jgi:hypothetical protein
VSPEAVIAVVGILTSGVLGPSAVAWWAGRRQARDHQHEVAKEVRDTIDQAAATLFRIRRTNLWVVRLWGKGIPGTDSRVREANEEQREAAEQSRVAAARLTVRLGPDHSLVRKHNECHDVLDEMVAIVHDHATHEPIDPFVPTLNNISERYAEATDGFLAAAHALAAEKLGDPVGTSRKPHGRRRRVSRGQG